MSNPDRVRKSKLATAAHIAARFGVSVRTVKRIRRVWREAPELAEPIERNEISVGAADAAISQMVSDPELDERHRRGEEITQFVPVARRRKRQGLRPSNHNSFEALVVEAGATSVRSVQRVHRVARDPELVERYRRHEVSLAAADRLLAEREREQRENEEKKLMNYLVGNTSERLSLTPAAADLGMSRSRLARIIKREFGVSLGQCLASVRTKLAKELLLETHETIVAIARGVGFANASHLSRTFLKLEGCRPGAWRRAAASRQLANQDAQPGEIGPIGDSGRGCIPSGRPLCSTKRPPGG